MKDIILNRLKTPFFIPSHTKGDKDFDGHGPNINCRIHIGITSDRKHILADINMKASETESDWTTSEGEKKIFIFPAGTDKRLRKLILPFLLQFIIPIMIMKKILLLQVWEKQIHLRKTAIGFSITMTAMGL